MEGGAVEEELSFRIVVEWKVRAEVRDTGDICRESSNLEAAKHLGAFCTELFMSTSSMLSSYLVKDPNDVKFFRLNLLAALDHDLHPPVAAFLIILLV